MKHQGTVIERFHEAAVYWPDAVALEVGTAAVRYRELCDLVDAAAAHLSGLELPRQSRVGLFATRDLSTYVAYLATLRLGLVVVPISPETPYSRQASIVDCAEPRCVILPDDAGPELTARFASPSRTVIAGSKLLTAGVRSGPIVPPHADDVAYILFTSGSTGRPKGVPITHANVSAYLDAVVPGRGLKPGARLSHTFALTFDPSVFDLFGAWTTGATLVVPRHRELLAPATYVSQRRLTHWYSVPSLARYARRIGSLRPDSMAGLQWSSFIGEPLTRDLALAWRGAAPLSVVENTYGPTELTVSCSSTAWAPGRTWWPEVGNGTVPIGAVYPDFEWLLIDADGLPAEEGEICVRGRQRFTGYLDPQDNHGRFVRAAGDRMTVLDASHDICESDWYRTGDRVRTSPQGLVHLGRIDRQVKVNGHRIELDEVEGAIRRDPVVTDVAVVAQSHVDGSARLVAFLCTATGQPKDLSDLLSELLPRYMIPESFVVMPALPVSASGKTDYAALQELT